MKREICDLHCHILPEMDDGCKNIQETQEVLRRNIAQNVNCIIATPHYYPKETISDFLNRREKSIQKLSCLREEAFELPRITYGAEVAYHRGLKYDGDLAKLCLGKSNYLLLEMPFEKWSASVLSDIVAIQRVRGINIIIAHLERYLKIQNHHMIEELLELDVLVQMNAENILDFWKKSQAKKMLKEGIVQLIASDCHNLKDRSPNLGTALEKLKKMGLEDEYEECIQNSMEIFREAYY